MMIELELLWLYICQNILNILNTLVQLQNAIMFKATFSVRCMTFLNFS